jgi:hypothetical protein
MTCWRATAKPAGSDFRSHDRSPPTGGRLDMTMLHQRRLLDGLGRGTPRRADPAASTSSHDSQVGPGRQNPRARGGWRGSRASGGGGGLGHRGPPTGIRRSPDDHEPGPMGGPRRRPPSRGATVTDTRSVRRMGRRCPGPRLPGQIESQWARALGSGEPVPCAYATPSPFGASSVAAPEAMPDPTGVANPAVGRGPSRDDGAHGSRRRRSPSQDRGARGGPGSPRATPPFAHTTGLNVRFGTDLHTLRSRQWTCRRVRSTTSGRTFLPDVSHERGRTPLDPPVVEIRATRR